MTQSRLITLRYPPAEHPYVALITGAYRDGSFIRDFDCVRRSISFTEDGTPLLEFHLPDCDALYARKEVANGVPIYFATVAGSSQLFPLLRFLVYDVASGRSTIGGAIAEMDALCSGAEESTDGE